jgi:hypothetical protein
MSNGSSISQQGRSVFDGSVAQVVCTSQHNQDAFVLLGHF